MLVVTGEGVMCDGKGSTKICLCGPTTYYGVFYLLQRRRRREKKLLDRGDGQTMQNNNTSII